MALKTCSNLEQSMMNHNYGTLSPWPARVSSGVGVTPSILPISVDKNALHNVQSQACDLYIMCIDMHYIIRVRVRCFYLILGKVAEGRLLIRTLTRVS